MGAREAIFESDVYEDEAVIQFDGHAYTMKYAVTKYGDFLAHAGTTGAFLSGKDNTIDQTVRTKAGSNLVINLANRIQPLRHNNVQLIEHLQVFPTLSDPFRPFPTLSDPPF